MKIVKKIILVLTIIMLIVAAFYARHMIEEYNKEIDRRQEEERQRQEDYSQYTGGAENDKESNNFAGYIAWDGVPLDLMYSYTANDGKEYYNVSNIIPTDLGLKQGAIAQIQDGEKEYVRYLSLSDSTYDIRLIDAKNKLEYVEIQRYENKKSGVFFKRNDSDSYVYFVKQMVYGETMDQYYDIKEDKSIYSRDGKTLHTVPMTVKGEYTIQDKTEHIGYEAFMRCDEITNIAIPNSVKFIEESAFLYCRNLESVIVPNGVTTIESNTFYECANMKYIELPSTITDIKENAFYGCNAVIRYAGTEEQWESINIQKQGWNNKKENNPQIIFNYNQQPAN